MKHICSKCVDEQYLAEQIQSKGAIGNCDYCDETNTPTITIADLADYIEIALEQHFQITDNEPSGSELMMMRELDYQWEREGEPVGWVIMEAVQIEEQPAEDTRKVLEEKNYDHEGAEMGGENPFGEEAHYIEKGVSDGSYQRKWYEFEKSLKTRARFFNPLADKIMKDVFGEIHEHDVVTEFSPADEEAILHRARVFQDDETLFEAIKYPHQHMGPPPQHLARAGRMNAEGIAVFYGATDPNIAVSEIRPPVGSHVVIGQFKPLRSLYLLDIEKLKNIPATGSVFDPDHRNRLERAKFLKRLSDLITRPVMPNDEKIEYLVTQVIAEYLSGRDDLSLDGLLYVSTQNSTPGSNIVLFHKSSKLKDPNLPEGTEINAVRLSLLHDKEEPYHVRVETPDENSKGQGVAKLSNIFEDHPLEFFDPSLGDNRKPSLDLDLENLQVLDIENAKFETSGCRVVREEMKKRS